jgi:hypothetical protein
MHSLLNVLRFCQLGEWLPQPASQARPALCCHQQIPQLVHQAPVHEALGPVCALTLLFLLACPVSVGHEGEAPLLGEDGQGVLHDCRELDYMTHIVLRMFENVT